jgi:hypothetical protein
MFFVCDRICNFPFSVVGIRYCCMADDVVWRATYNVVCSRRVMIVTFGRLTVRRQSERKFPATLEVSSCRLKLKRPNESLHQWFCSPYCILGIFLYAFGHCIVWFLLRCVVKLMHSVVKWRHWVGYSWCLLCLRMAWIFPTEIMLNCRLFSCECCA